MGATAGVAVSLPEMAEKWFNLNVLYVDTYFVLKSYYFNFYY